jgi:hypothetical protein
LADLGNQLSQKAGKDRSFPQKAMLRLFIFSAIVQLHARITITSPAKSCQNPSLNAKSAIQT